MKWLESFWDSSGTCIKIIAEDSAREIFLQRDCTGSVNREKMCKSLKKISDKLEDVVRTIREKDLGFLVPGNSGLRGCCRRSG